MNKNATDYFCQKCFYTCSLTERNSLLLSNVLVFPLCMIKFSLVTTWKFHVGICDKTSFSHHSLCSFSGQYGLNSINFYFIYILVLFIVDNFKCTDCKSIVFVFTLTAFQKI